MSQCPLVSVIVPCFNQAQFLPTAVESALAQTYPRVEVVVVDDGSTDGTFEIAQGYGKAIRLVRQRNSGLSAARNAAIGACSGEFVTLLDSDDALLPEGVASRMRWMLEDPAVGLVAGYYREVGEDGSILPRIPELRRLGPPPHLPQTVRRNWGPPVGWTIRRAALEQCGMFDESLRSCEDWDLLIRISARWKIAYDPEVGALYRQLPSSMSRNHLVMVDAAAQMMRKNASIAPNRFAYAWWCQFGRFQHGRRILFNVLSRGPLPRRVALLLRLCVQRPHLLWVGALSLATLALGKRPSALAALPEPTERRDAA